MRRWSGLGRQLEADLPGAHVRVLHLAVLELHVRAELVPGNDALRRAVDLLEQRLDLSLLHHPAKAKFHWNQFLVTSS